MRNFTLLLFCVLLSFSAFAADVVVTSSADSGAGTLREAIENASTTEVTSITFNGDMTITFASVIYLQERIDDPENPGTIIDGEGRDIIIDGGNHQIIFDGGNATNLLDASATSSLILKNVTLQNASKTTGRGAAVNALGGVSVFNCNFINNVNTNWAGAIYTEAPMYVENSKFIENEASNRGGALYSTSDITVVNSLFEGNVVNQGNQGVGSAICNFHGVNDANATLNMEIVNCTFVKNSIVGGATKPRTGGVIASGKWNKTWVLAQEAVVDIYNSVFWGNFTNDGTGAANGYASDLFMLNGGEFNLYNSIFEDVNPVAVGDIREEAGRESFFANEVAGEIKTVSNCFDGMSSTSVFNGVTPFVDYANDDYNLAGTVGTDSNPLIDAGTNSGFSLTMPASDLAGNNRVAGAAIDLGVYEYNSTPTAIGDNVKISSAESYYDRSTQTLFIDSEIQINNIEVYSLSGAKVADVKCGPTTSLDNLNNGLYIIRINKTEILKIVK